MIRRPPRSTLSSSSAASDVYKRQVTVDTEKDPDRWNRLRIHKDNGPARELPFPSKPTTKPVAQVGGGFADYENFNASIARRPRAQPRAATVRDSTTASPVKADRHLVHDPTRRTPSQITRHGHGLKKRHNPNAYHLRHQMSGRDESSLARDQLADKDASLAQQDLSLIHI